MKNKVFVTGASGFIGFKLAFSLLQIPNTEVHICLRSESANERLGAHLHLFHLHYFDLKNIDPLREVFKMLKPTHVFNCAEASYHTPDFEKQSQLLAESNLMVMNLMEVCREHPPEAFVHTCSSMVYQGDSEVISETTIMEPISFKGLVKLSERNILLYYAKQYHIPVRIARILRAYGPHEQQNRLIVQAFKALQTNTPMRLSSPSVYRNYIYIDDLVQGLWNMAFTELRPGVEIQFGSGMSHNCQDILAVIEKVTGSKVNISEESFPEVPADRKYYRADISKAERLLAWRPQTTLIEGIRSTYQWWSDLQSTTASLHDDD